MDSGCILAIDPGTAKIGYALVDNAGTPRSQGVVYLADWEARLGQLMAGQAITVIVLGDGTNRLNMQRGLERLFPQAAIAKVDETASTVAAWELKRAEEAGRNPLRILWFTLLQLFQPAPVDDYAARVLAQRYLAQRAGEGGRKT
jgi:RNase H-fold protein (predicted Holliday junction resolvase)